MPGRCFEEIGNSNNPEVFKVKEGDSKHPQSSVRLLGQSQNVSLWGWVTGIGSGTAMIECPKVRGAHWKLKQVGGEGL